VNPNHPSCLWLIPTSLGDHDRPAISLEDQLQIRHLQYFIVETEKTARKALKCLNLALALQELSVKVLNQHTQYAELNKLLQPLREGHDVGVMSDAGCPVIADPGAFVVHQAHREGFQVKALAGPSSIMLALMGSGAWGQKFMFHGYLPVEEKACEYLLKQLQEEARQGCAQIFIETPYRNQKLWERLLRFLDGDLYLGVSRSLTTPNEWVRTYSVAKWQKSGIPDLHKQPTVFTVFFSPILKIHDSV
jgi:16S rRNA (cytidine1402-2'-O)-methyltransferase